MFHLEAYEGRSAKIAWKRVPFPNNLCTTTVVSMVGITSWYRNTKIA